MKKFCFSMIATLLFGMIFWTSSMTAKADAYYWGYHQEMDGENYVLVPAWHSEQLGTVENVVSELPTTFTRDDNFYLYVEPTAECLEYLKSISGEIGGVYIYIPETANVQIGSPDVALKITDGSVLGTGNITVYADFEYVNVFTATTMIYGNVGTIFLGNSGTAMADHKSGGLFVEGDVEEISWYKTFASQENEGVYYAGFNGDCTITGTVGGGKIQTTLYDQSVNQETWQRTGEFGACGAGVFAIDDGVLSSAVEVKDVTAQLGKYTFQYQCYAGTGWQMVAYTKEGHQFAFSQPCSFEDLNGEHEFFILGSSTDLVFDFDINKMEVWLYNNEDFDITINGNVKELDFDVKPQSGMNLTVTGNVENCRVHNKFNANYNLTVGGTITNGTLYTKKNLMDVTTGYFSTTNKKIVISGNVNPELYIYTSQDENTSVAFQPLQKQNVDTALAEQEVGKEVTLTTASGEVQLVKNAEVAVSATDAAALEEIKSNEDLQDVLSALETSAGADSESVFTAEALCAVDIDVTTFYEDAKSGELYTADVAYGTETITELGDGKELDFTVKVPANQYQSGTTYKIVREHENADGTVSLEALETTQDGDKLSFASDKFSSFLIVEMTEQEVNDGEEDENEEGPEESEPLKDMSYIYTLKAGETEPKWYEGDLVMGPEKEVTMAQMSKDPTTSYCLAAVPTQEVLDYLNNLEAGYTLAVAWLPDATSPVAITLGSPEKPFKIPQIGLMDSNVTVTVYTEELSGASAQYGTLIIYGDVRSLSLGTDNTRPASTETQKVVINGNLDYFTWYRSEEATIDSFKGDLTVTGTLGEGKIHDCLKLEGFGTISPHTYTFKNATGNIIVNGVLMDGVTCEETDFADAEYTFRYDCYGFKGYNADYWELTAFANGNIGAGDSFLYQFAPADLPDDAHVFIRSNCEEEGIVIPKSVKKLEVHDGGKVVVQGDVDELIVGWSYVDRTLVNTNIDITVTGNVKKLEVRGTCKQVNITINGNVVEGTYAGRTFVGTGSIMEDGQFMVPLYGSLNAAKNQTEVGTIIPSVNKVNSAAEISDADIVKDSEGNTLATKEAKVDIAENTTFDKKDELEAENEIEILGVLDVKVTSSYYSALDGSTYQDETHKTETITELSEAVPVVFTVPTDAQDADFVFCVIREHNGALEVLEDADNDPATVTIMTDKFSAYMLVKGETVPELNKELETTPTPTPSVDPTVTPVPTPESTPTAAPTQAPTSAPTQAPTSAPTQAPTSAPTQAPTSAPTQAPTSAPTQAPTSAPTQAPTSAPTQAPTAAPTAQPQSTPAPAPVATPTPAPAEPINPHPVPTVTLRIGTTQRDAVRWLQTELTQAGYQLEIDGLFGSKTHAALMDYQLRHGLQVDGIFGPQTRQAMLNDKAITQTSASGQVANTYPAPAGILRVGNNNRSEVCWLQTELSKAGYRLTIDGLFGGETRAALMDYQLRHGLQVDGVCGPQTRQSMLAQ